MQSLLSWRGALSVVVACATLLTSAPTLHAQDTDQPDAPPDVQQLIDQAQNGQAPAAAPQNVQQLIDQVKNGQIPSDLASSPLPQQATLTQLRELLTSLQEAERQRQLLGYDANPDIPPLQLDLLTRDYNENVLPLLQNATTNCLVAELGFDKALGWSRQVQVLGLSATPEDTQDVGADQPVVGDIGPLAGEVDNVMPLYVQILENCDKEVYDACVRDDSDPNGAYLGDWLHQLAYLENDATIYQQRYVNCAYGWHGTFTAHEELVGAMQPLATNSNGSSLTLQWNASGARDFSIERTSKQKPATGTDKGDSVATFKEIARDPRCTTTSTTTDERKTDASGDASLRKISAVDGGLTLGFSGPPEPGAAEHTSMLTQSNCGGAQRPSQTDAVLPSAPFSGAIIDTLQDPLTESISGNRTLTFVLQNGTTTLSGAANTASIIPVPGGAGAVLPAPHDDYRPWLSASGPTGGGAQPQVSVRVTLSWELSFGPPSG